MQAASTTNQSDIRGLVRRAGPEPTGKRFVESPAFYERELGGPGRLSQRARHRWLLSCLHPKVASMSLPKSNGCDGQSVLPVPTKSLSPTVGSCTVPVPARRIGPGPHGQCIARGNPPRWRATRAPRPASARRAGLGLLPGLASLPAGTPQCDKRDLLASSLMSVMLWLLPFFRSVGSASAGAVAEALPRGSPPTPARRP